MTTYKTPDVYVEEISIFPPSVAEVETAIPAFIGYTEKALDDAGKTLNMKPTRIGSMIEYRNLFGEGPPAGITTVMLNEDNSFKNVTKTSTYYMYDCIRLFYANGGGDCYIVSVGSYASQPAAGDDTTGLLGGLKKTELVDEPTILLFPDGVSLPGNDLYTKVQPAALQQCGKLMDRVAVLDVLSSDPKGNTFRDNVGINNLKYGMAYTPWLTVNLGNTIKYRDLIVAGTYVSKLSKTSTVTLASLASDTTIQDLISALDNSVRDVDTIAASGLNGGFSSIRARYESLRGDFNGAGTDGDRETDLKAICKFLYDIAGKLDEWSDTTTGLKLEMRPDGAAITDPKQKLNCIAISTAIDTKLVGIYSKLLSYEKELHDDIAAYTVAAHGSHANINWRTDHTDATTNIFTATPVSLGVITGATNTDKLKNTMKLVDPIFEEIIVVYNDFVSGVKAHETNFEKSVYDSFPVYQNLIKSLRNDAMDVPPCGAVAGVYAAVDRDRGVWKAPANVSLSSVIGPNHVFTASELDALNIDVNAGKSINAIRSFTGKGTLIWGARTLAGNDNEWRYVPVRRFYNMVEESVKKSTYWAVFEPNSATTWVKVKGMIENYLTNKWKDGALAGAKPDEAFFVKVGLGITMSAQDILEGRMNIEIGMAVVRPAEFIVLKFSHKLQQS
jgi:hypothetical protein